MLPIVSVVQFTAQALLVLCGWGAYGLGYWSLLARFGTDEERWPWETRGGRRVIRWYAGLLVVTMVMLTVWLALHTMGDG